MRAALLLALVAAGCGGDGGGAASSSVLSASFANLQGANTSGVAISTMTVACTRTTAPPVLTCSGFELPQMKGREVDLSVLGDLVAGMDYRVGTGAAPRATVVLQDPTTLGTASGLRQWQSVDGTGAVRVVAWDGTHLAFSYAASMRALASPATGTFDLVGDGNIATVTSN